jgi:hypothetical protein
MQFLRGVFDLHTIRSARSRKQLVDRIRHHRPAVTAFEPGHQTDVASGTTDVTPRQPDAVGWADSGFAEMRLQLVCCEHELLFRLLPFRVVLIGIERVDHQRTIHLDRVLLAHRV